MRAKLIRGIDGDTAEFLLDNQAEVIRFHSVDCEESAPGLGKPMTTAGVMAKKFTSKLLHSASEIRVELDFPRDVGLEDAIASSIKWLI